MDPSNSGVLCDMTPCHWKMAVDVSEVFAAPSSGYKQCKNPLYWNYGTLKVDLAGFSETSVTTNRRCVLPQKT